MREFVCLVMDHSLGAGWPTVQHRKEKWAMSEALPTESRLAFWAVGKGELRVVAIGGRAAAVAQHTTFLGAKQSSMQSSVMESRDVARIGVCYPIA